MFFDAGIGIIWKIKSVAELIGQLEIMQDANAIKNTKDWGWTWSTVIVVVVKEPFRTYGKSTVDLMHVQLKQKIYYPLGLCSLLRWPIPLFISSTYVLHGLAEQPIGLSDCLKGVGATLGLIPSDRKRYSLQTERE